MRNLAHSSPRVVQVLLVDRRGGFLEQALFLAADGHFCCVLSGGEGNGNPLHCSCLEDPRDGGAWGVKTVSFPGADWSA